MAVKHREGFNHFHIEDTSQTGKEKLQRKLHLHREVQGYESFFQH